MTKRYVEAIDRSPFGEEVDEALLNDPGTDSSYIEGYGDVRRNRERAIRDGENPPPLRHRLHIARAKSLDGQRPDGRRLQHWVSKKGYSPLKWDEAIKLGYRVDKNPAYTKGEDGTVYHANGMLMIAGPKVAAANYKRVQREQEEQFAAPQRRVEQAVERFNRSAKGAHAEAFQFLGEDDPDEIAKGKRKAR